MNAAPILELDTRKMFQRQGLAGGTYGFPRRSSLGSMEEERREVLESVCRAMRQETTDPARTAACHFLLQHLSRG